MIRTVCKYSCRQIYKNKLTSKKFAKRVSCSGRRLSISNCSLTALNAFCQHSSVVADILFPNQSRSNVHQCTWESCTKLFLALRDSCVITFANLSNQKARKKLANQNWIHKQRDIRTSFWEPLRRRTILAVLSVCDACYVYSAPP